jgi:murein DD-endopeptidase MepM/ murein hydrolase activator NlpD
VSRRHARHARPRRLPRPRTLPSIVGVAAVATAAVGAADLTQSQQVAPVAAATVPAEAGNMMRVQAARRAAVMQASRGYTRTGLSTDVSQERVARHGSHRAQGPGVAEAVSARNAAIRREQARQRRHEEQQEQALARQRRIERRNRWVVPVSDYEITATFSEGGGLWSSDHTGLDFAAPEGTPVSATADGEVTSTGYDGDYGNQIVITHDDGTQTWYCHLSSIDVSTGQSVQAGTTIGAVGMTGNTTGPHLHLEVHPGGGAAVDPYSYLQEQDAL